VFFGTNRAKISTFSVTQTLTHPDSAIFCHRSTSKTDYFGKTLLGLSRSTYYSSRRLSRLGDCGGRLLRNLLSKFTIYFLLYGKRSYKMIKFAKKIHGMKLLDETFYLIRFLDRFPPKFGTVQTAKYWRCAGKSVTFTGCWVVFCTLFVVKFRKLQ
jgi:GT2 family glycosyltransferase